MRFAGVAAAGARLAVLFAGVAGFVELGLTNAVAAGRTAGAVRVAAVHTTEVLSIVAVFVHLLDDAVATVIPEGRARIIAVPVLAGVLSVAIVAELEASANPIAAGVAAFGMFGHEAVEGQSEVRLGDVAFGVEDRHLVHLARLKTEVRDAGIDDGLTRSVAVGDHGIEAHGPGRRAVNAANVHAEATVDEDPEVVVALEAQHFVALVHEEVVHLGREAEVVPISERKLLKRWRFELPA